MRLPRWLVRKSVRNPRTVLLLWASFLALAGIGVFDLEIDTSTDSVLDRSGPEWSFYQRSLDLFGGDEIVVLAVPSDEPFGAEALALVDRLSNQIRSIPGVRRVDSLSTVPLIEATSAGELSLDPALDIDALKTAFDRSQLSNRVFRDRIAPRVLVSDDGRLFAVNILLDRDAQATVASTVEAIQKLLPSQMIWVSGVPIFRTETNKTTASEITFFVALTIVIMASLLYLIFRTIAAVVMPLAAGAAGTWVLLSAMGLSGAPLSLTTMILPSVILAVGCANVMHVITQAARVGEFDSLIDALDPVILPVMLSGLTTTIGFLAVSGVPIEAIEAIGTYGALGVFTILGVTLTAIPSALVIWPLPSRELELSNIIRRRVCPWLIRIQEKGRRSILAGSLLVCTLACVGLTRLSLETDATTWFPRGSAVRVSYENIRDALCGISPMNVIVEATGGRPVTSPEVISAIADLTMYLENLPQVGRAVSLADPLRQLHGGFANAPEMPVPGSLELIEQYLLLLESVEQIHDLVTSDRSATNILLRVDNNGSEDLQLVADKVGAWWRHHGPPGFSARTTGIMFEFSRAEKEIAVGQLRGLSFALLSIAVILMAMFRRARLAASTLAANALPIVIAFGAMGLMGVPLDAGTVVVGNLAFGIAIDETLHLVSGLQQTRMKHRFEQQALLEALERCVPAILYTTAAIALGFGVFAFSEFSFTRNLGILTVSTMVLCVLADLVFLPALLLGRSNAPRAS